LTVAAGLETPASATQPFADVPADGSLARTLAPWIARGWVASHAQHRFEPDRAMPFTEFKQHAFNSLFASLSKNSPTPVDYRPWLVHDTFNRPDEAVAELSSGHKPMSGSEWKIENGQLRPADSQGTTYLLVDAGAKDVDASVDLFLEQTRNEAAAGIVVRAGDARNMQRFLLQAKGPAVEARIDAVVDGQRTEEERWLIPTIKRGFTLRVVAVGDNFSYWIDGAEVKRLRRSQHAGGTGIGVVNGGGESSRFDNLEVKHCR
jgi:hypothetical protein